MTALHSRYNPQAEAERYLEALSISPKVRCFILIEPGLGYMIPVLARRFPGARIIALHVSASRDRESRSGENAVRWDPALGLPVEDFLTRELEELDRGGGLGPGGGGSGGLGPEMIKIIEWRPSLDFYGDSCVKLLAAAAAAIRRFDAERRTLRAFGRRWFRNFFKNLRLLRRFPAIRDLGETPVLVTGSGPSLEGCLSLVKELRERRDCFIIAASSSAAALLHRGIVPDLVLSTDGGGWALLHLYELFRAGGPGPAPAAGSAAGLAPGFTAGLAAGLTAGLPSQCGGFPILGIADGSLWQGLILRGLGIPHLVLPQRGTVTATALDLALVLGRGKVFIAGLDLDSRDIRTHARPYSFDRLWREGATRFRGEYGQSFFRQAAAREGGSYRIYADWFASRLESYGGRLAVLGNNHPLFAGLPRAGARDPARGARGSAAAEGSPATRIRAGSRAGRETEGAGTPPREERGAGPVSAALEILGAALEDPKTRGTLAGELAPLLFPGKPVPGNGELRAEAESLVRPYLSPGGIP
jgi:hypothetical protein